MLASMPPSFVGAIAAGWLALAPVGDATSPEPTAWTLEWSAPPSCPSREDVRARVDALVPEARPSGPRLTVRGSVQGAADEWSLELWVGDAHGGKSRRMQTHECATLVEVTALITAIELDTLAAAAAMPGPGVPAAGSIPVEPVSPPPALELAPPPTIEAPPPPGVRPPGIAIGVHTGLGVGGLPAPSALLGGSVTVAWPRLRVTALGEGWPRQVTHYPNEAAGASLGLLAGGLRACAVLHPGPVEVPLCAGAWIGGLRGEGYRVEPSRVVTDVWVAAELEPGLAWMLRPAVALRLGVAGLVMMRRPAYRLRERPELFRVPPVGARITLALELRWRAARFLP